MEPVGANERFLAGSVRWECVDTAHLCPERTLVPASYLPVIGAGLAKYRRLGLSHPAPP